MKIVVLAGGQSPERNVSLVTGKAVGVALKDLGHDVTFIDPDRNLPHLLWQEANNGCDFVWLALHGTGGEDGTVQAILDYLQLPYQGPGHLSSTLAIDKWVSKQVFEASNLPTPDWIPVFLDRTAPPTWAEATAKIGSPIVVKAVDTGSTVGISLARTEAEYEASCKDSAKYSRRLFLEQFIPGKELTISVLGDRVLPAIEIVPTDSDFYDYDAKYQPGGSRHLIPTTLDSDVEENAKAIAKQAYDALHCEGLTRIDIRIDSENNPWILEANTLPGMTPTSLSPDAAAAIGWSFSDLVNNLLEQGLKRHQQQFPTVAS